jgi:hypothetical protein
MSKFCQYGDLVADIVGKVGLENISSKVENLSDYVRKEELPSTSVQASTTPPYIISSMTFEMGKPVSADAYALSDALKRITPDITLSALYSEKISVLDLSADNLTVRSLCNDFF